MVDPKNMIERLPKWFRDDKLAKTINDEAEGVKLSTYYKMLCSYPIQPIQVWKETQTESKTWEADLTESDTIELSVDGGIKFSPTITVEFILHQETTPLPIEPITDLVISADGYDFVIPRDFYPGEILTIIPGRGVLVNGIEIDGYYTIIPATTPAIDYGAFLDVTDSITFTFTPTQTLPEIDVEVAHEKYPSSNTIYGRFWTYEDFPFKEITFYEEDGTTIQKNAYKYYQDPPVYEMFEIENSQLETFYVGVQYHGLLGEILIGFPQRIETRTWSQRITDEEETWTVIIGSDGEDFSPKIEITVNGDDSVTSRAPIEDILIYSGNDILSIPGNFYPDDFIEINPSSGVYVNNVQVLETYELESDIQIIFEFTPTEYCPSIDVKVIQDDYASDSKYGINTTLDDIAQSYGLIRRKYREGLKPQDGAKTYPEYYLYNVEQDFYLENRILMEYFTREELSEKVTIYNVSDEKLLEITQKEYGSRHIDLACHIDSEFSQHLYLTSYDLNRDARTENYAEDTIEELVESINTNSKIITSEFVKEGSLVKGNGFIALEGIFEQFGGLAAEIFQMLGCIPTTIDITEYLLKWNIDEWGRGKKWAGDIYMPGTYFLQIPYEDIPRNFKLLSMSEITGIVDKYRMMGTRVFADYVLTNNVEFDIDLEVEHPSYYQEFCIKVCDFAAEVTDSLSKVCIRPRVTAEVNIEPIIRRITSGGAIVIPDKTEEAIAEVTPTHPYHTFRVVTEDGEYVDIRETVVNERRTSLECITEDGEEVTPAMEQIIPTPSGGEYEGWSSLEGLACVWLSYDRIRNYSIYTDTWLNNYEMGEITAMLPFYPYTMLVGENQVDLNFWSGEATPAPASGFNKIVTSGWVITDTGLAGDFAGTNEMAFVGDVTAPNVIDALNWAGSYSLICVEANRIVVIHDSTIQYQAVLPSTPIAIVDGIDENYDSWVYVISQNAVRKYDEDLNYQGSVSLSVDIASVAYVSNVGYDWDKVAMITTDGTLVIVNLETGAIVKTVDTGIVKAINSDKLIGLTSSKIKVYENYETWELEYETDLLEVNPHLMGYYEHRMNG